MMERSYIVLLAEERATMCSQLGYDDEQGHALDWPYTP